MAKPSSSIWHFLSRLAGLTALVAGAVGVVAWLSFDDEVIGFKILIGAAIVLALSLVPEAIALLRVGSSRRSAVGVNVAIQVALAAALVVGVNVFSYFHYERYDCTRDKIFTISDDVRQQLAKLQGVTDIVVLQQHISFGQAAGSKHDNYDAAAERKIVEKVKDLVEQFEELGPRFRVQVLDTEEEGFEDKVKAIRAKSSDLADAIKSAPENSIFFAANGKVQRLGFQDFYQLDRPASLAADDGRGNLILTYQGEGPFARKIFNVEERKPRIGVATVHTIFSLNDDVWEQVSLVGAKKVLESHGFDTTDIIVKKGLENDEPEPIVYTFDESKFEMLDDQRAQLEEAIEESRLNITRAKSIVENLKNFSLEKVNESYVFVRQPSQDFFSFLKLDEMEELKKVGRVAQTLSVTEENRKNLLRQYEVRIARWQMALDEDEPILREVRKEIDKLNVDELEEKQHITDLRKKMNRALGGCDLLIIPRATLIDIQRIAFPNRYHSLYPPQRTAIREFIKSGKPVLFCLGPTNTRPGARPSEEDSLEKDLAELGFKLPMQTVLFTSEAKSFVPQRDNIPGSGNSGGAKVDIPPVSFKWEPGSLMAWKIGREGSSALLVSAGVKRESASLRTSLRTSQRSLGGSKETEVNVRYPRPVYLYRPRADAAGLAGMVGSLAMPFSIWDAPVFWAESVSPRFAEENTVMVTNPSGWNEDQPFPSIKPKRIPHFEPAKATDPGFGTFTERRLGSFPIAAAADVEIPVNWFPERSQECWAASVLGLASCPSSAGTLLAVSAAVTPRNEAKVSDRLAVFGSGNIFAGKQLTPLKQKLLLDTCNWLLGREGLLATDNETWQYPRVHFSDTSYLLWQWITRAAMPLAFVYLGIAVWLVRRMR